MHDALVHWLSMYGYAVVFVLVALESVGIPLPGETALLTAAAFAAQGRLSIVGVIATAAVAAVVGDNGGYWIGRRGGTALIARYGHLLRVNDATLDRVRTFFARHGAKTVFLGRFVALLRTWTALFAGAANMPYGAFTAYNALGGVTWSVLFGMLGFAFGRNLPTLERYVGQAGLAAAVLVALAAGIVFWLRRHSSSVNGGPFHVVPPLSDDASSARSSLHVRGRNRSSVRYLAVGFVVTLVALWAFAAITEDVVHHDPMTAVDIAFAHWLRTHATVRGDHVASALSLLGSTTALALLGVLVASVLAWRRDWRMLTGWSATLCGGAALDWLLKHLIPRARPFAGEAFTFEQSSSFPSGHAMMSLIVFGMLSYLVIIRARPAGITSVIVMASAFLLAGAVAASRLYLGVHYLSDVGGGLTAGLCWLAVCVTAMQSQRRMAHDGAS